MLMQLSAIDSLSVVRVEVILFWLSLVASIPVRFPSHGRSATCCAI